MIHDDKLDPHRISHFSQENTSLSCRFITSRRSDNRPPDARELGELLAASIRQENGRMPLAQSDPREEIRKLYERAAVSFLTKLGIDYRTLKG